MSQQQQLSIQQCANLELLLSEGRTRWDVLQARVKACWLKQQQLVVTWEVPLQSYALRVLTPQSPSMQVLLNPQWLTLARQFTVLPRLKLLPMLATGTLSWLPATVTSVCQD